MKRTRVALIVAISAAVTLAIVGGLFVIRGTTLINDADAMVNAQNARGCGGNWTGNGSPPPSCAALAPGIDQPEGLEGSWYVATGEMVLGASAIVAVGAVVLRAWEKLGD